MVVSESDSMASGKIKSEAPPLPPQEESLENHSNSSSNKQNSIFSLTLDEFQYKSGKSFGSMNMDEFLTSVWNAEGNQVPPTQSNQNEPTNDKSIATQTTLPQQASFSIPTPLCKKTVDEVWSEIHKDRPQQEDPNNFGSHQPSQRQQTFGEMTLEDFLIKAGVVQEASGTFSSRHKMLAVPIQNHCGNSPNNNTCLDHANFGIRNVMGLGFSDHQNTRSNLSGNGFPSYQMFTQSGTFMGESSSNIGNGKINNALELGGLKSKRRIIDGPVEVVVERRQRRMIKNRESAARSRARKQAYTVELELELNQLKEENARLKLILAEDQRKRRQEVKREKQSTKSQKIEEKLRTVRRTISLAW